METSIEKNKNFLGGISFQNEGKPSEVELERLLGAQLGVQAGESTLQFLEHFHHHGNHHHHRNHNHHHHQDPGGLLVGVSGVEPDSPASALLKPGDLITNVNDWEVFFTIIITATIIIITSIKDRTTWPA